MPLTGTISFMPVALQKSQLDLVTAAGITPIGAVGTAFPNIVVANGTGANQATNYVSDTRTLAAGANEVLDFNGGIVDSFGNLVLFTRLILLVVKASPLNVADLQIVIPGSAPITTLTLTTGIFIGVPPGGIIMWASRTAGAYALTATTADSLQFTNASRINTATYDLIAVGS